MTITYAEIIQVDYPVEGDVVKHNDSIVIVESDGELVGIAHEGKLFNHAISKSATVNNTLSLAMSAQMGLYTVLHPFNSIVCYKVEDSPYLKNVVYVYLSDAIIIGMLNKTSNKIIAIDYRKLPIIYHYDANLKIPENYTLVKVDEVNYCVSIIRCLDCEEKQFLEVFADCNKLDFNELLEAYKTSQGNKLHDKLLI